MTYEGVLNSELIHDASIARAQVKPMGVIRWGIFGLPGMGKSSLCRAMFQKAKGYFPLLIIPEAADYAVKVEGYALTEFEPFLNQVYEQAENLAHHFASSNDDVVIIREPSIIQNEVYLIVQRGYRQDSNFRGKLRDFADHAQMGMWDDRKADEISMIFLQHKERLLNLTRGPWLNAYAIFTTENPIRDLDLSIHRQQNLNRDPRLVTNDIALLCGYAIGISKCANILDENGFRMLALDPEGPIEALTLELLRETIAIRS